jgi:hypothetical protein
VSIGLIIAGILIIFALALITAGYGWVVIIIVVIAVAGFVFLWVSGEKELTKSIREEEAQQRAKDEELKQKQYEDKQNNYRTELVNLGSKSMDTYESLAQQLEESERNLDQAMVDLQESAYSPFWSSIEKAAKNLANYDEGVRFIKDSITNYSDLSQKYDGSVPGYPLSSKALQKLDIATGSSKKLEEIVRIAQRNFEFSTIYEQRKTNQILIAGFTNLADALDRMTYQITSSIDDMNQTLNTSMKSIDARLEGVGSKLSSIDDTLSDHYQQQGEFLDTYRKATSEQASRENRILERLDNIQRGRSPVEVGIHRGPSQSSPFYPHGSEN